MLMKAKLIILGLLIPLFLAGCSTDGESVSSISSSSSSNASSVVSESSSESGPSSSSTTSQTSTSSETTVAVKSVSLNKTSLDIPNNGDTVTLTATVSPSNATNKEVTWSSSDVAVATVDEGEITPVGVGTTTITVTTVDGNKTATCKVNVYTPVPDYVLHIKRNGDTEWSDEKIVKNGSSTREYMILGVYLETNDEFKIHMSGDFWYGYSHLKDSCPSGLVTAASKDDNIKVVSSGNYDIYSSYDESDNGHIYLAKSSTPSGDISVTGIELSRIAKYLKPRTEFTLNAYISPTNATNKTVYWTSSDKSVATVSDGVVKGAAACTKGSTIITATTADGSYKATCIVYISSQEEPDYYLIGTINGKNYARFDYTYPAVPVDNSTFIISDVQLKAGDSINVYSYKDGHAMWEYNTTKAYTYSVKETMQAHIYLKPKASDHKYISVVSKTS